MMDNVSDVIRRNLEFYDQIKPKFQDKSYTVIATLNDVRTGQLIALTTGTKASLSVYQDDIEDCHAESLLKRAFKRYLIDAALEISNSGDSTLSCIDLRQEYLNNHGAQDLMMFISQFPCGLIRRFEGQEPVDEVTGTVIKRKPGRGLVKDGRTVYVERDPCHLKLKRWFSTFGLHGKSLHQLIGVRSRVTHLVIGDCEPSSDFNYTDCLNDLAQQLRDCTTWPLRFDIVSMRRDEFVFEPEKQPQPVAAIWWSLQNQEHVEKSNHNLEYLVDGRRAGLTKKQSQSACDRWMVKTGNYWLRKDIDTVRGTFSGL